MRLPSYAVACAWGPVCFEEMAFFGCNRQENSIQLLGDFQRARLDTASDIETLKLQIFSTHEAMVFFSIPVDNTGGLIALPQTSNHKSHIFGFESL